MFVLSQSTNPTPTPVAAFTGECGNVATCTFHATPWADPDGGVVNYRWNFGDGTTRRFTTSTAATHRYAANGTHAVSLTVATTSGATATTTQSVTTDAKARTVQFVGANAAGSQVKHATVRIPRRVKVGNALVLFASYASTSVRAATPKGWKLVGRSRHKRLSTRVYERVAHRHDAHTTVRLKFSHPVDSTLVLAAYRHTASPPITRSKVAVGGSTKRHSAPALQHLLPGSWVIGYWSETSHATTRWRLPHSLKRRASARSDRRGVDSAVLADSDAVVAVPGTYRPGSARSTRRTRSAAQWSIALAPALR
jgi:PKD repeat protein